MCLRRAEEVSEETDEGQQHTAEVAGHVRRGGRPEENVRTELNEKTHVVASVLGVFSSYFYDAVVVCDSRWIGLFF